MLSNTGIAKKGIVEAVGWVWQEVLALLTELDLENTKKARSLPS